MRGQVYLAQKGDLLKIGYSKNSQRRVRALRGQLVWTLETDHAHDVERRAHKLLEPWCEIGEWFAVSVPVARWAILKAQRDMLRWHANRPERRTDAPLIRLTLTRTAYVQKTESVGYVSTVILKEASGCPPLLDPKH